MRRTSTAALTALSALLLAAPALAGEPRAEDDASDDTAIEEEAFGTRGVARTRADVVRFDARERSVELSGDVRIDAPPFHLRSDRLELTRTRLGIEADGQGRLAFCPCLGTPLTISFDRAIVAPPAELLLRHPTLRFYGVPVLWLPWFWMRGDQKIGLLPPDVAYRGQDGLFLGGGVHLPWVDRGARRTLDLRGGAYVDGGFATEARLRVPSGAAKLRFDRFPGGLAPTLPGRATRDANGDDGLAADARGADVDGARTLAWDVDVVRGRRGVAATTDLDAAAKPWDRASGAASLRAVGPLAIESGVRAVTRRGGDLVAVDAWGPFAALRTSGALGASVTYDATIEGGSLRLSGPAASALARDLSMTPDALTYARADVGVGASTALGPLAASLSARGAGDLGVEGRRDGGDRAATARLRVGAPLARAFGAIDDGRAPLVHVIEPFTEASIRHAAGDAILETLPGRGLAVLSGTTPVAGGGVRSALGRWPSREAVELALQAGVAYAPDPGSSGAAARALPIARGRLSATLDAIGAQVESGHVLAGGAPSGNAVVARVRVGLLAGPRLVANVAARDGIDPALARALAEPSMEAPAGLLARQGTTGGASVVVPWLRALSTSAGLDVDLGREELVAARAGLELRDRCNCVTLRANGAHRIGREGVDVWVAIDFAADR